LIIRGALYSLETNVDGSLLACGNTFGSLDGQSFGGYADCFISRFNVDGTNAWNYSFGGQGYENATDLSVGKEGEIYVAGWTANGFEGHAVEGGGYSNPDGFISKYLDPCLDSSFFLIILPKHLPKVFDLFFLVST
jgi:hypothetical protein